MLSRMTKRGMTVTLKLKMGAQTLAPSTSYNVVGEIVGYEKPNEVVVIGGHMDSWDLAQGVMVC